MTIRVEEEMIVRKKTIYVADDGTEFSDENSCMDYEDECEQKKLEYLCDEKIGISIDVEEIPFFLKYFVPVYGQEDIRFFKISKEEDIELLCSSYGRWSGDMENHPEKYKKIIPVPCTLCMYYDNQVEFIVLERAQKDIMNILNR